MSLGGTGDGPQSLCSKFPGLPVAGSMDVLAENLKFHFGRCGGPGSRATITVI